LSLKLDTESQVTGLKEMMSSTRVSSHYENIELVYWATTGRVWPAD